MQNIPFKRHRFPPEIIRHAVWLYARITQNHRDVEDLLAERVWIYPMRLRGVGFSNLVGQLLTTFGGRDRCPVIIGIWMK